jgi:hypothetical protein
MRNYRKTRKHGGMQFIPAIYTCPPGANDDACAQDFAAANGFEVIETADDGNCFYDSVSKYGQRTGNPAVDKPHMELRREVVQYMINNQALYAAALIPDNPKARVPTPAQITARLTRFFKSRTWSGGLGDIFPQVAAQVFGINITIYDIKFDRSINMIAMGPGPQGGPDPALPVINLIRTNGNHFRLLWPAAAPPPAAIPPVAPPRAPSPPKARAPSPPRPVSPPKPAPPPARTTARKKPQVAPQPGVVNKLGQNVKAMGIGNAAPVRQPSPPKRLTARQKSMMALAAAKAAAGQNANVKPAAPRRVSRRKPVVAKNSNSNGEKQFAKNLQAALAANAAMRRQKNKQNSNSNNELKKAMELSMINL